MHFSTTTSLSILVLIMVLLNICEGQGLSPLTLDAEQKKLSDSSEARLSNGPPPPLLKPFTGVLGEGQMSHTEQQDKLSVQGESSLRVKRGGGYYGGYGGYGGGQWTSYCCNYGYKISPGCQYNGFWNANNNPYCY